MVDLFPDSDSHQNHSGISLCLQRGGFFQAAEVNGIFFFPATLAYFVYRGGRIPGKIFNIYLEREKVEITFRNILWLKSKYGQTRTLAPKKFMEAPAKK